ncbi:acyltransferase family protein [Galbitalea soli]|uniref:Acyltransferase n=1 Tax=Galbitalea soli TaxID=1268042 RepID=A0A7C9PMD6_9MICO|nr:acyltransferase family protein [Galbitalea soli]NEM90711.1 acyltransferase [Galbitalea soli]NYJ31429.1 peptidoglycan/LPS O-acetylase OafA/YrhL [Galbitalea soli]
MTTTTLSPARPAAPALPARDPSLTPRGDRRFRPDIQGLRAIAVLLVVLYHAGVPGVPGGYVGVDVFFVISGFLITRQLLEEALGSGRVRLARFWARRIRRLLPSALLVVAATVVAARIWGPPLQATATARDGVAAALYSLNYLLAGEGVDYQHATAAPSPLQHFWSLAVEEQFYLVWPLLIAMVALVTRGRLRPARLPLLLTVIAAGSALSLQSSVATTAVNAPLAYFALHTRAWELGVGALIAVGVPLLVRLPAALAAALPWLGLVAIVGSSVSYTDATPFPGIAALVPVLGAGAVITGGLAERPRGVDALIGGRVTRFLGTMSYGWYLWHWPAIILGPALFGIAFGWPEKLELSVLALWLAVLGHLVIERRTMNRPLRTRRWIVRGGALSALVALLCGGLAVASPSVATGGGTVASLDLRAAQSSLATLLSVGERTRVLPANLTPSLVRAARDTPPTTADGCHLDFSQIDEPACVYGDTTARRTIVLFGDSHAEQWFGAVDALGIHGGWRVVAWTKAACPVAAVVLRNPQLKRTYTECGRWRERTLRRIAELHPEVVIASQADTLAGPGYANAEWGTKTAETLHSLQRAAGSVVLLGDTPHPLQDVPGCLAGHPTAATECAVPIYSKTPYDYLTPRRAAVVHASAAIGVPVIDPTPWFCTSSACPAVVANTLVYRDDSHMTQHYSRALEPMLSSALEGILPAATQPSGEKK